MEHSERMWSCWATLDHASESMSLGVKLQIHDSDFWNGFDDADLPCASKMVIRAVCMYIKEASYNGVLSEESRLDQQLRMAMNVMVRFKKRSRVDVQN